MEEARCSRCFGKAVIDFAELAELEEQMEKTLEDQLLKVQKLNDRKAYLQRYQARRRALIKEGKWVFKGEDSGKGSGGVLRTRRKDHSLNLTDLQDLLETNEKEADVRGEGQSHLKDAFEDPSQRDSQPRRQSLSL